MSGKPLSDLVSEFRHAYEQIVKKQRFEFVKKFCRLLARIMLKLEDRDLVAIAQHAAKVVWDSLPERVKR